MSSKALARNVGIEIIDGKVTQVERGPEGVAALHLEDGRKFTADLYIDSSGFRSELLGRAFEEPYVSYSPALFCDRAVIGGWDRGADEPILPYTTAETMDAGWAWQIEHEHHINRGYVYSSRGDLRRRRGRRVSPQEPEGAEVAARREVSLRALSRGFGWITSSPSATRAGSSSRSRRRR